MAAAEQNCCFVRIGTDLDYCFCHQHDCYLGKRNGNIKSSDFQKGFDPKGMIFVLYDRSLLKLLFAVVVCHWNVFDGFCFFLCLFNICRQSFLTNIRYVFFFSWFVQV